MGAVEGGGGVAPGVPAQHVRSAVMPGQEVGEVEDSAVDRDPAVVVARVAEQLRWVDRPAAEDSGIGAAEPLHQGAGVRAFAARLLKGVVDGDPLALGGMATEPADGRVAAQPERDLEVAEDLTAMAAEEPVRASVGVGGLPERLDEPVG